MLRRRLLLVTLLLIVVVLAPVIYVNRKDVRAFVNKTARQLPFARQIVPRKTVEEQIEKYGATARVRLAPKFQQAGLAYPPDRLSFVAIKDTRDLQVYAANADQGYKYVCSYQILGASGVLGPKLKEGDCQVPEGLYIIESLEPNTPWHLGLRVNYPNVFDLARAQEDGRANPGSDILIHGNTASIGCLAMGDEASEDLFVLVYDSKNVQEPLIICPVDFRKTDFAAQKPADPPWLPGLYIDIKRALARYPAPPP